MKLLFFVARNSEAIKLFLLNSLKRSQDYPVKVMFTMKFNSVVLAGLDEGDLLYIVRLDTTLLNFLPSSFFRKMLLKGIRKAGIIVDIEFIKPKEALLALCGLEE